MYKQTLKDHIQMEQYESVMERGEKIKKGWRGDLQVLPRAVVSWLKYETKLGAFVTRLICKIFDHKLHSNDGANPAENGSWGFYCERCGYGEHGYW